LLVAGILIYIRPLRAIKCDKIPNPHILTNFIDLFYMPNTSKSSSQPTAAIDTARLPQHIAIIMDGNRRWARAQGLDPTQGHRQAAEFTVEPIIRRAAELGIPYLTFWAFSTENWKRDQSEVQKILEIFRFALAKLAIKFIKFGAKFQVIGDLSRFPKDIINKTLEVAKRTSKNHKITVSFALNYGGRDEILRAVKKVIQDKVSPESLTPELFSSYLDTKNMPDPELVIRSGGESRTSGYLPWQTVYSELCFVDTLWPDFTPAHLDEAIIWYQNRDRRLGK
jgi:undecaprenyl diphosphate synthase